MNKKLFLTIALVYPLLIFSQINKSDQYHKNLYQRAHHIYTLPFHGDLISTNYLSPDSSLKHFFPLKKITAVAEIAVRYFIVTTASINHTLTEAETIKKAISSTIPLALIGLFILSYKKIRGRNRKNEQTELQKKGILKLKVVELQKEKETSKYYKGCLEELKTAFIQTTAQLLILKKQMNNFNGQEEIAVLRASVILTHKDWLTFKLLFDKSYPNFTNQLVAKNKYLTTAEIRFMMLKKINLSNQDMARSQGVGNNAVHKTNSRIRQKLLCTNEELNALIKIL